MCTNLVIQDQTGQLYQGRTMELGFAMRLELAYYPVGSRFTSRAPQGYRALQYESAQPFLSIDVQVPEVEAWISCAGINGAGLTVNMNVYKDAALPAPSDPTRAVLSVADLGTWLLASCGSCTEVRELLRQPALWLETLAQPGLDGLGAASFHYAVFDRSGQGLVIEFDRGAMQVHDNPVGVMTNGPSFDWHLKNLDNYAFASNLGKREQRFGRHLARTEDVGNAMVGLPVDDTSSARFVRAAYYAQFCRQATHPDEALAMVAKIINKFDRPRGATNLDQPFEEEWTLFTTLSDLGRGHFYIRPDDSVNYLKFDLSDFSALREVRRQPFSEFLQRHIAVAQPVL